MTKGTAPANTLSISAATNRVNGWSYDAAGNVLNDGSHAYAYDANNMITSVDGGAVQYKYDSGGRRVMRTTASETTYYAFGAEYSSVSGWKRVFVAAAGMRIEYRDGQTYFHQTDHLGTPRVQTDSAGNLIETWSYYPFGEQWEQAGSGGNEHRFTGHRRDAETGNDYAGARYLRSAAGRWGTVDPLAGNVRDPQSLNRYAYVVGDPVNHVDPDGQTYHHHSAFISICYPPDEPSAPPNCVTRRNPFYQPGGYRPSYIPTIPSHPTGPQVRYVTPYEFESAVADAIDQIEEMFADENIDERCKSFLNMLQEGIRKMGLGVDISTASVVRALRGARIMNGVWDTQTWSSIAPDWWASAPEWLRMNRAYSTPRGLFAASSAGLLPYAILAVASTAANTIWVNGLEVGREMMAQILFHEALHLLGLRDRQLAGLLPTQGGMDSESFQSAFEKACFGEEGG